MVGSVTVMTLENLIEHVLKMTFLYQSIDTIVDLTIGYEMLSLMDGFSGYN